jgi:hypothetical protein
MELEKLKNLEAHHGENGFVHVKITDLPPRSRRLYEDRQHRIVFSPQAKEVIKLVNTQPHLRKLARASPAQLKKEMAAFEGFHPSFLL